MKINTKLIISITAIYLQIATITRFAKTSSSDLHETSDKRLFVLDLLRLLQEQHPPLEKTSAAQSSIDDGSSRSTGYSGKSSGADRRTATGAVTSSMSQLLNAIGADGDAKRLLDWVQSGLNLATVGELTTQFVVGKLASVNCPALLQPDPEENLVPRFLLFNEHFTDVPFELPPVPVAADCLARGHFDPQRKTLVLIHGYLGGYTLIDGFTNIKNRLLDLSRWASTSSLDALMAAARNNATSYLLADADLETKVRSQQYNVIMVDWFHGANPVPRARYIRAAVNAQVVGRLIARFLLALVERCRTPADHIEVLAHSLGCHVAGFTGKAMNAAGQPLGRITHLDPIGLCFGRLFSRPHLRLSAGDARETRAVHVSLNLYDNPLDGAHSNFLVNGGRDQSECGGHAEVKNSTTSSVSLLFDSEAKFSPCSHLRALALYEDDHSSAPGGAHQCQLVGYRCASYERFLAGKCGHCDAFNSQCRLMSFDPIDTSFRRLHIDTVAAQNERSKPLIYRHNNNLTATDGKSRTAPATGAERPHSSELLDVVRQHANGSIAWLIEDNELNQKIGATIAKMKPELGQQHALRQHNELDANDLSERADRSMSLPVVSAERIALALDKIRQGTKNALVDGWTTLSGASQHHANAFEEPQVVAPKEIPVAPAPLAQRPHTELPSPAPVGGQQLPAGGVNGPLYFLGAPAVSPFCVNYYQFRVLIAESRIKRLAQQLFAAAPQSTGDAQPPVPVPPPSPTTSRGNKLHLTVKLTDSFGRFFKGFSLVEDIHSLSRASDAAPAPTGAGGRAEPMLELTMLLNTTRAEPVRITETIISYYFHRIVLADTVEVNYMSNISPEVRARHSSLLCPVAINDQHQLVRYIECDKISAAKRRR